jgi:hypothetical protein
LSQGVISERKQRRAEQRLQRWLTEIARDMIVWFGQVAADIRQRRPIELQTSRLTINPPTTAARQARHPGRTPHEPQNPLRKPRQSISTNPR